jgi:kojibiose phosphorylase
LITRERVETFKVRGNKAEFAQIQQRPFSIIVFDWDGTAVKDRTADATQLVSALEELLKLGVYLVVVTGTNIKNIDRQFSSFISGPHKANLLLCANRGSEVYGFDAQSRPFLLWSREASDEENELLDRIAEAVKGDIEGTSSVTIDIIYQRLNRRKIDLIPEWPDPPKSQIDKLIQATEERLKKGGFGGGIKGAFELAVRYSREMGLADARITSDVKHVEVGLTDKSDSIRWVVEELAKRYNIPLSEILVIGDEFGPVAGFEGSDFRMVLPEYPDITYLSVGKEPCGVPTGVIHLGGGPTRFLQLIREQVELHKRFVPIDDPSFALVEEGYDPPREREIESLFAVGNGYLGTRGSLAEQEMASTPATMVAGVYDRISPHAPEELVIFPDWLFTQVFVDGERLEMKRRHIVEHRRVLDMRKGVFFRELLYEDSTERITQVKFMHFVSLADPHAMVLKVTVTPKNYSGEIRVVTGLKVNERSRPPLHAVEKLADLKTGGILLRAKTLFSDISIAQAQRSRVAAGFVSPDYKRYQEESSVVEEWRWQGKLRQSVSIEKYVSIYTSRESKNPFKDASEHVLSLSERGLRELLLEHEKAWEERWGESLVTITGDRKAQLWINFAVYQLVSAGNPHDERVSIGARGLTGHIYRGHIFWDSEMYILPFFIYTHPATARAMLMYRYHTLPGARKKAAENGYRGAQYAWESASTGEEVTPPAALLPTGEVIPIMSGKQEHHITADVAYGVWSYWKATGDLEFFLKAGVEILVETARFWCSRVERRDGEYHILNVVGPDEYHEGVDDNFYTNLMAAWNLERAVEAIELLQESYPDEMARLRKKLYLEPEEPKEWSSVASRIYRDMGREDQLIEQFAGFLSLQDIDVSWYEPRTAPLEVILGKENIAEIQLVKQADVVMALYLLEEEFDQETVRKNFLYYHRHTDHGSSLSPSIHGLVAARLGLMHLALEYFRRAGQIDLANNMGNASGGVHAAALGGFWQLIIMGFAGLRATEEGIFIYPHLPAKWKRLRFALKWRGLKINFDLRRRKRVIIHAGGEGRFQAGIFGRSLQVMEPGQVYVSTWDGRTWSEFFREG